jgi:hypothetical protein
MLSKINLQQGTSRLASIIIAAGLVALTGGVLGVIFHMGSSTGAQANAEIGSALSQINNTLVLKDDVTAHNTPLNDNNSIGKIEFTLLGNGTPVDMTPSYLLDENGSLVPNVRADNQVQIAYDDGTYTIEDCAWTISFGDESNGDYLLDAEEEADITVWLQNWDGNNWYNDSSPFLDSANLQGGQAFSLKIFPGDGVPFMMGLATPYRLKPLNRLN